MTTLLLHGLGADRRQSIDLLSPAVRAASGDDELIIAPDVRAHGGFLEVGSPADFEIDRLADELADAVHRQVMDATGETLDASAPITVAGISMGAAIALRIALLGLLPIERAVFIRPSFDDRSLPDNLRAFPVIGQLLVDAGPGGAEEFRERTVFRRVADESPAGGKGLLAQFNAPDAARRAMRLIEIPRNRAFRSDAELAELAARGIRSLVVGAPRDPVHPLAIAEHWAGALSAPLGMLPARDDGQARQDQLLGNLMVSWLERSRQS